jgi:hypothetical protein
MLEALWRGILLSSEECVSREEAHGKNEEAAIYSGYLCLRSCYYIRNASRKSENRIEKKASNGAPEALGGVPSPWRPKLRHRALPAYCCVPLRRRTKRRRRKKACVSSWRRCLLFAVMMAAAAGAESAVSRLAENNWQAAASAYCMALLR